MSFGELVSISECDVLAVITQGYNLIVAAGHGSANDLGLGS
jgi:hypothetical protein